MRSDKKSGPRATVIGRGKTADDRSVCLWSDGSLTWGALGPVIKGSPHARTDKQIADTLPKADQLEVRVRTSTIQPGAIGEWHSHAAPPIVYVLEGTLSVEVRDRETIHTKAGEAAIEPINTVIRATNKGQTPVKLVIFQVSPPDVPFAHPAPQQ